MEEKKNWIVAAEDELTLAARSLNSMAYLLSSVLSVDEMQGENSNGLWALMEAAENNAARVRSALASLDKAKGAWVGN